MAILVTGGAGFIGSVTVDQLLGKGEDVVVVDNLSRGHRRAIPSDLPFYCGNAGDRMLLDQVLHEHEIEACIHFAAFAYPGESVESPQMYYENNLEQSIALVGALCEHGIKRLVFSSTCAAFGEPQYLPIDEAHPQNPPSPYGWSKMVVERVLESYDDAYDLRFVALRYFNACGATPELGEDHEPETHLLPLILHAAQGKRPGITVFGNDYPTPDGTCIRDYVHVTDLARAHMLALKHLREDGRSEIFNLGNGNGYSVLQCIRTAEEVTGLEIATKYGDRRPGDVSHLVADSTKARTVLGWQPQISELKAIIQSAWDWYQKNPNGYQDQDV